MAIFTKLPVVILIICQGFSENTDFIFRNYLIKDHWIKWIIDLRIRCFILLCYGRFKLRRLRCITVKGALNVFQHNFNVSNIVFMNIIVIFIFVNLQKISLSIKRIRITIINHIRYNLKITSQQKQTEFR